MRWPGTAWNTGLERVMGIEPTLFAWEARVLPLNDTREGADYRQLPQTIGYASPLRPSKYRCFMPQTPVKSALAAIKKEQLLRACCTASLLDVAQTEVFDLHVVVHAVV